MIELDVVRGLELTLLEGRGYVCVTTTQKKTHKSFIMKTCPGQISPNCVKQGEWKTRGVCYACRAYRTKHSEWYRLNQKKQNEKVYRWRRKNKDKVNAAKREKLKSNHKFKIITNLRIRMWHALQGHIKAHHMKDIVGIEMDEFLKYIEGLWKPGMTWDNYGKKVGQWDIDHIRPCASFDISLSEEQSKCFNYLNTQPMWACENSAKSDSY
jgi:hypothetical protein